MLGRGSTIANCVAVHALPGRRGEFQTVSCIAFLLHADFAITAALRAFVKLLELFFFKFLVSQKDVEAVGRVPVHMDSKILLGTWKCMHNDVGLELKFAANIPAEENIDSRVSW